MKRTVLCLRGLLCISALTQAGCILDTDQHVASSPRAEWHAPSVPAASTPEAAPVPSLPGPLGLTELLDEGLSNNPQTQSAWYNAKAAAARRIEANSTFYPSVNGAYNGQRQRMETIGYSFGSVVEGNPTIIQKRTAYGPMLDVSWTLFSFGADAAKADAAREALYAANFQYNRTLQTVVLSVQRSYYNLDAAQAAVAAEEASLKDAQAGLDAAEAKQRVGLSPIQDVLTARANLLQEQYRLETARSLVETARANLAQAIGRRDIGSIEIKAPDMNALGADPMAQIKDFVDRGLSARPDLQAAYANVRANEASARSAERSLLPRVVAGFGGDLTKIDGFAGTEDNYLASLRLSWDIFDGFKKEATVLENRAKLEAARRDAVAAELGVVSEIWTEYYSSKTSLEQLKSADGLVNATNAAWQAIDTGYRTGLNSILDLLSAQKDLANARVARIRSQNEYITALLRLQYAVGGLDLMPPATAPTPVFKDVKQQ